jgi:rhamnogalacturonyl hydrolase YesR
VAPALRAQEALARERILATIEAVADWQLTHLAERVARPGGRPQRVTDRSWIRSVFFTGVVAAYRATGEQRYLEAAVALGERNRWRLGPRADHADDHCVGQVYAELYLLLGEERMIQPTRERFDRLISKRRREPLWSWADALFMSPPAAAMLAAGSGESRYLDWLVSSWRQAQGSLYDRQERLWYRDRRFVIRADGSGPREANGAKLFWGRGNGWVLAGLARVLTHMPSDYPERARFERLMQEMAARLVELQGDDGLWRSSLLDPATYPQPEGSASALIAFGLAAGINGGILEADEYGPAAWRAWRGLEGLISAEGRIGWIQPVGGAPAAVRSEDSAEFGSGALLLAAEQMLFLVPD